MLQPKPIHASKMVAALAAFLLCGLLMIAYSVSPARAAGSCSTTGHTTTCTFSPQSPQTASRTSLWCLPG